MSWPLIVTAFLGGAAVGVLLTMAIPFLAVVSATFWTALAEILLWAADRLQAAWRRRAAR